MSAKELFEKLGFVKTDGYIGIMYIKDTVEKFELLGEVEKRVFVHFANNTVNVSKSLFLGAGTDEDINMSLLQAINQQCKDLGWIE